MLLENLNLPLDVENAENALMIESAVLWIEKNTTFRFDTAEEIPANVKLFIVKYADRMRRDGVTSESIAGMSQSFESGGFSAYLRNLADELLSDYGFSSATFVPAQRRWM